MNFCDDRQYIRFLKRELEKLKESQGHNVEKRIEVSYKEDNGKWGKLEQDMVNHPPHYKQGGVEVIDVMKAKLSIEEYKGFLKGNALKYLFRMEHKGRPAEDAKKAQWYINKLVEVVSNDGDVSQSKE